MSVFKKTLAKNEDELRIETCWSDFKCFNVKFYICALVGVMIKVNLQNARCNNKDNCDMLRCSYNNFKDLTSFVS